MSMRKIPFVLLISLISLNLTAAETSKFSVNYGLHYGTGFFEHDSDNRVTAFIFSGSYKPSSTHTYKLSLSYNRVEFPQSSAQKQREGTGDMLAAYKYRHFFSKARRIIDLETKVKIPTADEDKGLGTGELDFSLMGSLYQHIDNYWIYTKIGHKWRGDSDTKNMDDGYFSKIGLSHRFNQRYSLGGNLAYHQASSSRSEERKEALLHLSYKLTKQIKTTVYTVRGYTDASPKWSGGIQFSQRF